MRVPRRTSRGGLHLSTRPPLFVWRPGSDVRCLCWFPLATAHPQHKKSLRITMADGPPGRRFTVNSVDATVFLRATMTASSSLTGEKAHRTLGKEPALHPSGTFDDARYARPAYRLPAHASRARRIPHIARKWAAALDHLLLYINRRAGFGARAHNFCFNSVPPAAPICACSRAGPTQGPSPPLPTILPARHSYHAPSLLFGCSMTP